MKVTVLGSGNVSSSRLSPCYLIDEDTLLDMAPGSAKRLISLGHPLTDVKHVVVTHFHADHVFDLFYLILAKMKSPESGLTVFGGSSGPAKIDALMHLAYPDMAGKIERFQYAYRDEQRFSLNGYAVTRLAASHGRMTECFGYVFDDGRTKVGFSGDSTLSENVRRMASECRHFVLECTLLAGTESHMGVEDIRGLVSTYPNCHFYTTHMSEAARASLSQLQCSNLTVLDDFDTFTF